jgi:hypothetical protein
MKLPTKLLIVGSAVPIVTGIIFLVFGQVSIPTDGTLSTIAKIINPGMFPAMWLGSALDLAFPKGAYLYDATYKNFSDLLFALFTVLFNGLIYFVIGNAIEAMKARQKFQ